MVKSLLIISGVLAIAIGGALLFVPVDFQASAGINLGEDISLLSEVKAPGGTLLVAGIIIFLGAFFSQLTFISIVLSSLFYLSYGFSRVLSMVMDGLPNTSIVMATVIEIIIGLFSVFILNNFRRKQQPAT